MTTVVLRAFRDDDVDDLVAAFADPEISAWNPQGTTREEVLAWVAARRDRSAGHRWSWAVEHDGRLAGSVSLFHVDEAQGDGELGYWVAPWARRRGVATAALRAATDHGFASLGLHRLSLFHAVENVGSCAVATAGGFVLEGTLRESHRYGDGRHHDEHLHARLAGG